MADIENYIAASDQLVRSVISTDHADFSIPFKTIPFLYPCATVLPVYTARRWLFRNTVIRATRGNMQLQGQYFARVAERLHGRGQLSWQRFDEFCVETGYRWLQIRAGIEISLVLRKGFGICKK